MCIVFTFPHPLISSFKNFVLSVLLVKSQDLRTQLAKNYMFIRKVAQLKSSSFTCLGRVTRLVKQRHAYGNPRSFPVQGVK